MVFENTIIRLHKIEEKDAYHYQGRAKGYQLTWKKTAAAPGRVHVHDPVSEWWAIALTLVRRYVSPCDKASHATLMQQ